MLRWMMKKWPIQIRDDRGRVVSLTPPVKYDKKDYGGFLRSKYIGNHAGHGVDATAVKSASALYGGLGGMTMIASQGVAQFALRGYSGVGKQWLVLIIAGMLGWPFFPVVVRYIRQKKSAELRGAYIKARHCASCDFDLNNLPVESDGCTKCPECDAAWRLEPVRAELTGPSRVKVDEFVKRFLGKMEGAR